MRAAACTRRSLTLVSFFVWLVCVAPLLAVDKRVALLVGNNSYQNAQVLKNCRSDATAVALALQSLGFQVRTVLDANRAEMEAALDWFREAATDADLGLFYYSGHGLQVGGTNFLIPVDARVAAEGQVKYQAINANFVADDLARTSCRTSIIILDACRNNPFLKAGRGVGGRGLTAMDAHPESYVAFAADAGQVADDNPGEENGLYTSELLKHLTQPGLSIEEVFKKTRAGVWERSQKRQLPAEYSRLMRNVCLTPAAGAVVAPASTPESPSHEREASAGLLSVTSVPAGAAVLIDDRYTGKRTPVDLDLPPGTYRVTVRLAGYGEWSRAVVLGAGGREQLDAALAMQTVAEPVPPPASAPRTDDAEVPGFIAGFVRRFHGADTAAARDLYADRVDYMEYGIRDWGFIRRDLEKLNGAYPQRDYRLLGIDRIARNGDAVQVEFRMSFDLRSRSKRVAGEAAAAVVLEGASSGRPRIARYSERVTTRAVTRY